MSSSCEIAETSSWSTEDSAREYGIGRWGDGYFAISADGTILVTPDRDPSNHVDLKQIVDGLVERGLELPILLRFNGILRDRLHFLHDCFAKAITDLEYQNRYRCVFPIKVNQQRDVIDQIATESAKMGFGLEAGSKAELLAAIAMSDASVPIVCNGFKDEEFIRLALLTAQMGRTVLPIIEKASELELILRIADELGIRPQFGIRVKLATRGSGRWQASGGYRSKFGLTVSEVLAIVDRLLRDGMADCFQLLHFHVGSQIGNIRQLKSAILEAARIYVDLKRRGAAMGYLDVGGGLGVDYDGTQSNHESSMNYTVQEYANDVVFHIKTVCDEAGVPHPELLSESGRAIAAHHSVLIAETLGTSRQVGSSTDLELSMPDEYEQPVRDLQSTLDDLCVSNLLESFHDAQVALDLCMNLFSGGYLPLEQRVAAETTYFKICEQIRDLARTHNVKSDELQQIDRLLSDIYFVNFSIFQSLPDAWAIGQMFPVMPIHRLKERPTRTAVIGDITCDSDGKLDSFICGGKSKQSLQLHSLTPGQPYWLGVFFVGAYQETLGDLHNLFGDTHAVHLDCAGGQVRVHSVIKGDTVSEVLGYMQYHDRELLQRVQSQVEQAVEDSRISQAQAGITINNFERALSGYTYLTKTQSP